jgi:hypothetical protein
MKQTKIADIALSKSNASSMEEQEKWIMLLDLELDNGSVVPSSSSTFL